MIEVKSDQQKDQFPKQFSGAYTRQGLSYFLYYFNDDNGGERLLLLMLTVLMPSLSGFLKQCAQVSRTKEHTSEHQSRVDIS